MGPIEKAIQKFAHTRLDVYRADPKQIVRDTRVAERATGDHAGRWLFELLQNSDDAGASEVRILVQDDAIYVADNGHGLKPEAVSAICGTDFSDKTTGTIGRKGVGFKSVYEVSSNPQVLTIDGEGIEFSRERAKNWLQQGNLDDSHVPYQWIPFFVSWKHVEHRDPRLDVLRNYKTVVGLCNVLPGRKQKVTELLKEWPPHALFAFRHVRQIKAPGLEITLTAEDCVWSMRDSRGQTPSKWRVARCSETPPVDLLTNLGANESRAISADGVGFLIAAPVENGSTLPTTDYLPVHVFYPTEQKGPVRLLLHAEFLVKSDRTALMPIDDSPFNAWIADRLACHVCEFVNASYRQETPSSHAALLVPFGDKESHLVAKHLWQRIAGKAQAELRLADVNAQQRLTVADARLISASVRNGLARTILGATDIRSQLLHSAFDEDKEARKALRELGCEAIDDESLMEAIAENAGALAADTQWVWACWEWLAAWTAKRPYGEEHEERVRRAGELPIVPVDGYLLKTSDLAARIVTWRPDGQAEELPDWLPLTFVDDWFRDRIGAEAGQESPVATLCEELDISEPGSNVVQRAVGQAIGQHWTDRQGDPGRFLRFIMNQDWHETTVASALLSRCPVPLSQAARGSTWSEAGMTYFGREWGNDSLADIYAGIEAVDWVAGNDTAQDKEEHRHILEWLGVADHPRIVEEHGKSSVWKLPEGCDEWRDYLRTAKDECGRHVSRVGCVSNMDHASVASLDQRRAPSLIRLIAGQWASYYSDHARTTAEGTQGKERYYREWSVSAKWWWEVCEKLPLPRRDGHSEHVALAALWIPDKRTQRAMGDLLPLVDLDVFGDEKDAVRTWLISVVGLRARIEQLTVEEWKQLLSSRIPIKAPAKRLVSDDRLRDKVTAWYTACLETVAEQDDVSQKALASCSLLCRKGDVWQYVADGPRYLDDDSDLAKAFAQDVWLFHIPARLVSDAVRYLGVLRLSQSVEVDVTPEEPASPLSAELKARLDGSLPYVWAWRSSQSKQAADRLPVSLKELNVVVVPALRASLSLDGVHHEVDRPWHVIDDTIYLGKDHANETSLAQALARALEVRSEADFYENLLRCNSGHQLKKKLLSKGMADAEVDRCIREYAGQPPDEEQEEAPGGPVAEEPTGDTSPPHSTEDDKADRSKQPSIKPEDRTSESAAESPDARERRPLHLKSADTTEYIVGSPPKGGTEHSGGSGGGGGTGQEGHPLTDEEKNALEAESRRFAADCLESMGFSVEEMPQDNPGFDLRANKDGEELRVEVKAHTGRATIVDVTQRQYREYLGQEAGLYRWELWNVEHLTENDTEPVAITRYDSIPEDALDVRTFRVDLKKCRSSVSPSPSFE